MKKLILASVTAALFTTGSAWAACSADIQMNASAPTDTTGNTITNVPMPTNDTDVATKMYVDSVGNFTQVSSEQSEAIFTNAALGCANLEEGGFDDWFLPSVEHLASGVADTNSLAGTYWTTSPFLTTDGTGANTLFITYKPDTDTMSNLNSATANAYVCMR